MLAIEEVYLHALIVRAVAWWSPTMLTKEELCQHVLIVDADVGHRGLPTCANCQSSCLVSSSNVSHRRGLSFLKQLLGGPNKVGHRRGRPKHALIVKAVAWSVDWWWRSNLQLSRVSRTFDIVWSKSILNVLIPDETSKKKQRSHMLVSTMNLMAVENLDETGFNSKHETLSASKGYSFVSAGSDCPLTDSLAEKSP